MKTDNLKFVQSGPSELVAALHTKCPKCSTGNTFINNTYSISGQKMNENCPYCGFHFEVEPGYFYVSMFVSYALTVALLVTLGVGVAMIIESTKPWVYITVLLTTATILSPVNFKYSRVILLFWLTPGVNLQPGRIHKNEFLK